MKIGQWIARLGEVWVEGQDQPINEIAYELAFSDPSHFARFFRKQTGTAPHEFREARGG